MRGVTVLWFNRGFVPLGLEFHFLGDPGLEALLRETPLSPDLDSRYFVCLDESVDRSFIHGEIVGDLFDGQHSGCCGLLGREITGMDFSPGLP
jgi:hypothetical protein